MRRRRMTRKETEDFEDLSDVSAIDLDLDDAAQLPHIMGWSDGYDYLERRARYMEEVAEELGPPKEEREGRRKGRGPEDKGFGRD